MCKKHLPTDCNKKTKSVCCRYQPREKRLYLGNICEFHLTYVLWPDGCWRKKGN